MRIDLDPGGEHLRLRARTGGGDPSAWREVVEGWRSDNGDRFAAALAGAPFEAAYWECPPLLEATLDEPFECVLLNADALAGVAASPREFREHLARADGEVVTFSNLGADARLVAPVPRAGTDAAHLLSFCRSAGSSQARSMFAAVAAALEDCLSATRPTWLSTSGLGVPWLHIRLDSRPKYYQHAPYRRWPPTGV